MRSRRWLARLAVCLTAPGLASAFTDGGRSKVAVDALRLAPPALARQLRRHEGSLVKGASQKPPVSLEEARNMLTVELDGAVAAIDQHKSFRKVSEILGRIAGSIAVVNNPLWGVQDPSWRKDSDKFAWFFEDRMKRFPLVFNGYDDRALQQGGATGFVDRIRSRYRSDGQALRRAYHPPDGGPILPSDFDDRSVPFAIASLAYSHAVTDTAQAWILIWRRANGDLSGTPYLKPAPRGKKR